jgi:hypothetical protein
VEFGFLRTQLELTAGNLSQHLGVLIARVEAADEP